MKNSVRDAFGKLYNLVNSGKMSEKEFIGSIAAFHRDQQNGRYDGWGLRGFADNYEKWLIYAKGNNNVYLICERCKKKAVTRERELSTNAYCPCGGRRIREDQATAQMIDKHEPPSYKQFPYKSELEAAFERAEQQDNIALCRIIIGQLEKGNFRHDRTGTGADM